MTHPRYAAALQLSLLTSLGLLPLACGGSSTTNADGEGGSAGSSSSGSSSGGRGGTTVTSAGSGQGGTTVTSAGSSQGGTAARVACTSPVTNPLTGLVTCKEGYSHRPTATSCAVDALINLPVGGASGAPLPNPDPLPRADGTVVCGDDPAKCSDFAYGYCSFSDGFEAPTCRSGCFTDDDCGQGFLCSCGNAESPTGGVCRSADCRTNANCADGNYCASYSGVCGPGGFACHTKADECRSNEDCGADAPCMFNGEFRTCSGGLVCGRPFLIEHEARVAEAIGRRDWSDELEPQLTGLSDAARSALAAHWTRLGQLEHASIAAFARFSLQLLALGAPPELVEQCTAALADETAHAKLCFGIASAFAGRSIGPGRLDIAGSLNHSSLAEVVDLVIAEGCFGETSAALEALADAEASNDPVLQRVHARIAADEQRHAELAFRFVRWALERDAAAVRPRVATACAAPPTRDEAARHVTLPCLEALLTLTANDEDLPSTGATSSSRRGVEHRRPPAHV